MEKNQLVITVVGQEIHCDWEHTLRHWALTPAQAREVAGFLVRMADAIDAAMAAARN